MVDEFFNNINLADQIFGWSNMQNIPLFRGQRNISETLIANKLPSNIIELYGGWSYYVTRPSL